MKRGLHVNIAVYETHVSNINKNSETIGNFTFDNVTEWRTKWEKIVCKIRRIIELFDYQTYSNKYINNISFFAEIFLVIIIIIISIDTTHHICVCVCEREKKKERRNINYLHVSSRF